MDYIRNNGTMQDRLKGKRVIVVGSATGIGAETARRIVSEGASVVLADVNGQGARRLEEELCSLGGKALALAMDVADEASVNSGFAEAVDFLGGLDGVHINAAALRLIPSDTDVLDMDMAIFDETIQVNLRGHVLCTRAALPPLLQAGGGAIVYTSSGSAQTGDPVRPSYSMSKNALHALMRHVASRWGQDNITANVVAPGFTVTPEMQASWDAGHINDDLLADMRTRLRSPRFGKASDLAGMVALLLSEDGRWINGQVYHVNGGAFLR